MFATFNFVGDTLLLARLKLATYNAATTIGAAAQLVSILAAVALGLQ